MDSLEESFLAALGMTVEDIRGVNLGGQENGNCDDQSGDGRDAEEV
jgi:hypothetical protein